MYGFTITAFLALVESVDPELSPHETIRKHKKTIAKFLLLQVVNKENFIIVIEMIKKQSFLLHNNKCPVHSAVNGAIIK